MNQAYRVVRIYWRGDWADVDLKCGYANKWCKKHRYFVLWGLGLELRLDSGLGLGLA